MGFKHQTKGFNWLSWVIHSHPVITSWIPDAKSKAISGRSQFLDVWWAAEDRVVGPVGALEVAMGFEHQISLGHWWCLLWDMFHENYPLMNYQDIYHLSHVTTWRSHQIPGVHTFCRGTLTHAQFVSGCCPIRFRTHIEALSSNGDILWETTVLLSWIWKTNQSQIQINEWSQIEFDTGKGPRVIESKSIINPPNCRHIHQKHR